MKTFTSLTKSFVTRIIPAVLFGVISIAAPLVSAIPAPSDTADDSSETTAAPEQSLKVLFAYQIENRADPFIPFISDKAASANINEIVPVAEQLSGMQLFEPGQLTLVAIVMTDNSDFAMAEDTTGKGYILHAGMKIGKRGIITSIQTNEVTIEETAFTRAGKKLTSTIVMLLKKEGEE